MSCVTHFPMRDRFPSAFTLIELLVVIAIIGVLSSVVMASVSSAREGGRDARRLTDLRSIRNALELYYSDHGEYPPTTCPCNAGGWETSDAGDPSDWLQDLAPYFPNGQVPVDPINRRVEGFQFFGPRPANYFYAYYRYPPMPYCQCDPASPTCRNVPGPFAVVGISNLEKMVAREDPEVGQPLSWEKYPSIPRAICGDPGPDGVCSVAEYTQQRVCRDWSQEFDASVMIHF